jgi:hypothetical protein
MMSALNIAVGCLLVCISLPIFAESWDDFATRELRRAELSQFERAILIHFSEELKALGWNATVLPFESEVSENAFRCQVSDAVGHRIFSFLIGDNQMENSWGHSAPLKFDMVNFESERSEPAAGFLQSYLSRFAIFPPQLRDRLRAGHLKKTLEYFLNRGKIASIGLGLFDSNNINEAIRIIGLLSAREAQVEFVPSLRSSNNWLGEFYGVEVTIGFDSLYAVPVPFGFDRIGNTAFSQGYPHTVSVGWSFKHSDESRSEIFIHPQTAERELTTLLQEAQVKPFGFEHGLLAAMELILALQSPDKRIYMSDRIDDRISKLWTSDNAASVLQRLKHLRETTSCLDALKQLRNAV